MYPETTPQSSPRSLRRTVVLAGIVFAILIITYWVYSHAFITITVNGAKNGDTHYELVDQKSRNSTKFTSPSNHIKKLVHKGSYELMVQQGNTSHFLITKTGSFLTNTSVSGSLVAEKARKFVGDNPSQCMYYSGSLLLSYGCNGLVTDSQIHLPASASQPTITQKNAASTNGAIEGDISTREGSFLLLKVSAEAEDTGTVHGLYPVNDQLQLGVGVILNRADSAKTYSIAPYGDGFILYNDTFSQVLYYPSVNAQPKEIIINNRPSSDKVDPYALTASHEMIALAFTNSTKVNSATSKPNSSKQLTQVAIGNDNDFKLLTFNKQYTGITFCGSSNKLCMLTDKMLEVYDVSGKKQKLLYSVGGTSLLESFLSIQNVGNNLIVLRDNQMLELNIDNRDGYIGYSPGSYNYCGMHTDSAGYTLCLINTKQSRVALHIDNQNTDNNSIDQKVAQLLKLPEVDTISAYGQYIYIVPNAGQLTYDSASRSFGYDPEKLAAASDKINQEINKLGIDRSNYIIRNTSQP